MRVNVLILVLTLLGMSAAASAEKVKTNQSAKLYSRPGEQATVLLKVKSGQNMTVIAKEGRWLKVRVQGRTGYVPRSKVDLPDDDEIVRNTRRRPFVDGRSTKRGFGGAEGPDDRVGADATGQGANDKGDDDKGDDDDGGKGKKHASDDDDGGKGKKHASDDDDGGKGKKHASDDDDGGKGKGKGKKHGDDEEDATVVDDDKGDDEKSAKIDEPKADQRPKAHVTDKTKVFSERDADSDTQFTARPTDVLFPTETKGPWTFVENEEGDGGWVMTSKLDLDGGGGGGPGRRTVDLRARLGVTFIQQGMRTAGSTNKEPDNYNIGTSAFTLALGGGILVPRGTRYIIGGDLAYNLERAFPGIAYQGMAAAPTNIGITVHQLDLRAVAGIDLHKPNGMAVFGRLGYRYQAFLVDDYADLMKNPAPLRLPSETLKAPTLGVALAIPRLTDKVGLRFALDAILFGASITQTQGLEDGSTPTMKDFCFGGVFTYRWKHGMDLQGTYDLNYASYDFGAPLASSMRVHTGTDVTRTDIFHTVTFGILKGF